MPILILRPRRAPALALLTLAILAAPLAAQARRDLVLVRVVDAVSGAPVTGADVLLGEHRNATDSLGLALLPRAPTAALAVRRLGYQSFALVSFGDAWEMEVMLDAVPVRMAGVRATVDPTPGPRVHSPALRRFYARVERGHGAFLTRDDLDRRKPRRLVDAFREVPGIRVVPTPRGEILQFSGAVPFMYNTPGARAGDCPVQYYLDGSSWEPDATGVISNDVRPDEVEGIEIYRRATEIPPEFRRPGSECGVVLIWLKEQV